MARRKVKLAYIVQNHKRNSTFRKRKNGLIKKINELTVLCGVEACAIIYNQNDPQPEVWPSESGTQHVLNRLQTTPQIVQSKNKLDQESYLNLRIHKAQELLMKQQNDNKKKKMENMVDQFMLTGQVADNADMTDLLSFIDEKLKGIDYRMEPLQSEEGVQNIGAHTTNVVAEQTNMGDIQGVVMEGDHMNMDNVQGMMIGEEGVQNIRAHTTNVGGEQTNMGGIQGVVMEEGHMNMDNLFQGMRIGEEQVNTGHIQGPVSGGQLEAYTGHSQGLETNMGLNTNMDHMQVDPDWPLDFTNNNGGVQPFGDVDGLNSFWLDDPHFP